MHFERERFTDVTLTLTLNLILILTLILNLTLTLTLFKMHWFTFRSVYDEKSWRNPVENALVYISFCVARQKSEIRALGHDT